MALDDRICDWCNEEVQEVRRSITQGASSTQRTLLRDQGASS